MSLLYKATTKKGLTTPSSVKRTYGNGHLTVTEHGSREVPAFTVEMRKDSWEMVNEKRPGGQSLVHWQMMSIVHSISVAQLPRE